MRLLPRVLLGTLWGSVLRAVSLAATFIALGGATWGMHAALRSAEPAASSILDQSPARIRLEFTEPVEPALSAIVLVTQGGDSLSLSVAGDPRSVHAIVATPPPLGPGPYGVVWRIVSADGHRLRGSYRFAVRGNVADSVAAAPVDATVVDSAAFPGDANVDAEPAEVAAVPPFAGLLRGLALTGLLAFVGLTALMAWRLPPAGDGPIRAVVVTGVAGSALLAIHLVVWMSYVAPGTALSSRELGAVLTTWTGRLEVARVLLAVAAVWGVLARRNGVAALLGIAAVAASSAIGHPAAISPLLAIPGKLVHLLAAAIWIGGVLWIATAARAGSAFAIGTRRVSALALASVALVVATGIVEAVLFLPTIAALWQTTYGQLVLAKSVGTAALVAFGARHRRLLAAVESDSSRATLGRSVRGELGIMVAVAVLGGVLAYVSPRL